MLQGRNSGGKALISTVNVMAEGVLRLLDDDIQYQFTSTNFNVGPSGIVMATNLLIETDNVNIEEGGIIDLSERSDLKTGKI